MKKKLIIRFIYGCLHFGYFLFILSQNLFNTERRIMNDESAERQPLISGSNVSDGFRPPVYSSEHFPVNEGINYTFYSPYHHSQDAS